MEFIKSWKFMAVIVAVLTIVAVVLVAYGVATHTEPGLMEAAHHWDHTPIGVCSHSYTNIDTDNAEAASAVATAIGVTNSRLGFDAYTQDVDAPGGCYVIITVGVPTQQGWMDPGGDAVLGGDGCEIQTANTGTTELLGLVLQHELGHCLGLAHDPFESSIMFYTQSPTPDAQFPPRITDSDRALLRQAYMPQP